jgi:hypothetical protein
MNRLLSTKVDLAIFSTREPISEREEILYHGAN